jgi:hypothetical protein
MKPRVSHQITSLRIDRQTAGSLRTSSIHRLYNFARKRGTLAETRHADASSGIRQNSNSLREFWRIPLHRVSFIYSSP